MAQATFLEVGDAVPLSLQIVDGATDQYPQAEIYDNEGNNLTTISLSHVGDGLYQPSSPYTMPDEVFINAVYIVYSDSGHTTESGVYLRDMDTFVAIDPDDYKAVVSALATTAQLAAAQAAIIAEVDANETKIDALPSAVDIDTQLSSSHGAGDWSSADIDFLKHIEGGRWKIDTVTNQMRFYKADNVTEVARFNLLDADGAPASADVFERVRVTTTTTTTSTTTTTTTV
ncbi:MAG: hypothetical protein DRJ03_01280 [Chloroflexi bacterium]|nr:MAG: hypothetical protein DRJ03_01280 [Chloroflexota bacterium]